MAHPLRQEYQRIRSHSLRLIEGLSAEDAQAQSMPDASPIKWHLAHTTWFFETFILEKYESVFTPFRLAFKVLYNSYYNSIGEQFPRAQRGLITRPGLAEVIDYRHAVDRRVEQLIDTQGADTDWAALLLLGLQHEQQHQELMLTDLKHLLSLNPEGPLYRPNFETHGRSGKRAHWISFDGGLVEIGADGRSFCFDNEFPRHRVFLAPYELASGLATEGDYLEFIEAGGYENPAYWLSEGWAWRQERAITRPLYWGTREHGDECFTLGGWIPLEPDRPLRHISYFEAEAYARFRGARLPTEAEWEHALVTGPSDMLEDVFGWVWQWTASAYAPYPGFREAAGAVGEYNGKFMVNQYVLKGSSLATPQGHDRDTYRNFFPTTARWQFTGIRLARDP
jgi:ergothioneine biosynthesis protein EgtB